MAETVVDLDKPWFPPLCVKTGQQATSTVKLKATHTPAWVHLLLPIGLLLWIRARSRNESKLQIAVPVSNQAWSRYQTVHWAAIGLGIIGLAVLVGSLSVGHVPGMLAGGCIIAVAVPAYALGEAVMWVGIRYLPARRTVIISRAHPSFTLAVAEHYTREYYR
jgi:hypothetical protein